MPHSDNNAIAHIHDPANKEKYLNKLWKELDYGVAFVATDGTWLEVNSYLCELLEYTESELKQRNFKELTHPDDVNDDIEMSRRLHDGVIDSYIMQKRYLTKTGKIVWAKLKVTGMDDDNGNFVHFISQVAPALVIQSSDDYELNAKIRDHIKQQEKYVGIWGFVKKEFKWLLTTVIVLIGLIINQAVDFKIAQHEIETNASLNKLQSAQIEQLEELVGQLQNGKQGHKNP